MLSGRTSWFLRNFGLSAKFIDFTNRARDTGIGVAHYGEKASIRRVVCSCSSEDQRIEKSVWATGPQWVTLVHKSLYT
jgi:hypothetical protein